MSRIAAFPERAGKAAVIVRPLGLAAAAAAFIIIIELIRLIAAPGPADWTALLYHALAAATIGAAAGALIERERHAGQEARATLDRLSRDVTEFQKDDTVHRLSGLSESGRNQEDLRSVMALDEAFYHALETGRELLQARAVVLYWRNGPDENFHLRESAADRDDHDPPPSLESDEPLARRVIAERAPVRLSGRKRSGRVFPALTGSLKSPGLLAAPVVEDRWVHGVVIAVREAADFSPGDDGLIAVLAGQVRELHRHALLVRRSEAQAARFKSLASLVHRLSRTLDHDEIVESVLRTGAAVTGHDAGAVVLPDDDDVMRIVAVDAGMPAEARGAAIETDRSLTDWVISEQKPLVIADLRERDKNVAVLGPGLDPPAMRSVLIRPLPLSPGAGALVFFAEGPNAFSGYTARVTEMLADFASVSIQNARNFQEMERRAVTDGLTGLINHRTFQERLADEIERAGRLDTRLAIIMCDIDHFKSINDAHGHPVGDEVLKHVAAALRGTIRKVDAAARYGGEEFVLVLPGTDGKGALELAERLRKKVARLVFPAEGSEFRVTISLGIALYPDHTEDKERLIELADQALYRAKKHGRNRTVIACAAARPAVTSG